MGEVSGNGIKLALHIALPVNSLQLCPMPDSSCEVQETTQIGIEHSIDL